MQMPQGLDSSLNQLVRAQRKKRSEATGLVHQLPKNVAYCCTSVLAHLALLNDKKCSLYSKMALNLAPFGLLNSKEHGREKVCS